MELMLWLLPMSVILTGLAVAGFLWAVKRAQFDDLDRHALDILDEDKPDNGEK